MIDYKCPACGAMNWSKAVVSNEYIREHLLFDDPLIGKSGYYLCYKRKSMCYVCGYVHVTNETLTLNLHELAKYYECNTDNKSM